MYIGSERLEELMHKTAKDRSLQAYAKTLNERGIFTGGPYEDFERVGRIQLSLAVREGLNPWSKILDIGCGMLRGGYWLIHFLDSDCYYGIEPNISMTETGLSELLEPEVRNEKRPTINQNDRFDLGVFSPVKFDMMLARSIWTHASKPQIQTMLDGFVANSNPGAFFLTSFLPTRWPLQDYKGATYQGRSHVCDRPAQIRHKFSWIKDECEKRKLKVQRLPDGRINEQEWLKITR